MSITQKELEEILLKVKIGNPEFWEFLKGKIKSFPGQMDLGIWGCFPILDKNEVLYDIRVLVPKIIDEATLLVNIHELAHAYELYGKLGNVYNENVEQSEQYAKDKEKEYLELKK